MIYLKRNTLIALLIILFTISACSPDKGTDLGFDDSSRILVSGDLEKTFDEASGIVEINLLENVTSSNGTRIASLPLEFVPSEPSLNDNPNALIGNNSNPQPAVVLTTDPRRIITARDAFRQRGDIFIVDTDFFIDFVDEEGQLLFIYEYQLDNGGLDPVNRMLTIRINGIKHPAEEISAFNANTGRLQVGEIHPLVFQVLPSYTFVPGVIWSSSDESIATVDPASGEITPLTEGMVMITGTEIDSAETGSPVSIVLDFDVQASATDVTRTDLNYLGQTLELLNISECNFYDFDSVLLPLSGNFTDTIEWSLVIPENILTDDNSFVNDIVSVDENGTVSLDIAPSDNATQNTDVTATFADINLIATGTRSMARDRVQLNLQPNLFCNAQFNGSFESSENDVNMTPRGWTTTNATATITDAASRHGEYGLHIQSDTTGDQTGVEVYRVQVGNNQEYLLPDALLPENSSQTRWRVTFDIMNNTPTESLTIQWHLVIANIADGTLDWATAVGNSASVPDTSNTGEITINGGEWTRIEANFDQLQWDSIGTVNRDPIHEPNGRFELFIPAGHSGVDIFVDNISMHPITFPITQAQLRAQEAIELAEAAEQVARQANAAAAEARAAIAAETEPSAIARAQLASDQASMRAAEAQLAASQAREAAEQALREAQQSEENNARN